jgi:transcription elongation GreA/GreB family factor
VLERVGWRFWRCFASSFYRDPDGVLNDLIEILTRMGIQPIGKSETGRSERRFTEHRTIEPATAEPASAAGGAGIDLNSLEVRAVEDAAAAAMRIGLGDKVVLVFADDQKRISARVSEGGDDLEKGRLSVSSPLGRAILGAEEGDEVELPLENGRQRKVLIESVEKSQLSAVIPFSEESSRSEAVTVA